MNANVLQPTFETDLGGPPPPETIGSIALARFERAEDLTTLGQAMGQRGDAAAMQLTQSYAAEEFDRAQVELFSLQQSLRGLAPDQRAKVNTYLGCVSAVNPQDLGLTDRVAILEMHPERLKLFIQWHKHHIAAQQEHPDFHQAIQRGKEQHVAATDWALQQGWLALSTEATHQMVMEAPVYVGDLWQTTLQGRLGYRPPEASHVVIAQGVGLGQDQQLRSLLDSLDRTASHEYEHLRYDHRPGGSWLPAWLKEARAEHFDLAKRDQTDLSFSTFNPSERDRLGLSEGESYTAERLLLSTLLEQGREKIDPQVFTLGASSQGPMSHEWQAVVHALDRAWDTPNVVDHVSRLLIREQRSLLTKERQQVIEGKQSHMRDLGVIEDEALANVQAIAVERARTLRTQKPQHHVGAAAVGSAA